MYALGYDIKRNHKILRFVDDYLHDQKHFLHGGFLTSLPTGMYSFNAACLWKGNTYFFAHEKIENIEDFLLSYDFTKREMWTASASSVSLL